MRLSQLIDFLPDATLAVDLQGRVTIWNRAMENMTGVKTEDILGKGDYEYSLPFYGARRPQLVDLVFKSDEKIEQKYQFVQREGEFLLAEADVPVRGGPPLALWGVACALYDGSGNVVGALESIRDVTDRKRAEEQTRIYALELERSNRDLEQFAYVSSHDLQEPLRKIIAFGDRLKDVSAGSLEARGLDYLNRMQAAALRMRQLIEDLLAYSRLSRNSDRVTEVDLGKVLKDVLLSLEYRIEETGGKVEAGKLPVVDADPMLMRQLFQNLLGNALKFHRPNVPPRIAVGSRECEDGRLEITLADNGIGFDEKYLDRIFMPFQRLHTRTEYEGTGMGLAICHEIVERHGWTITANSIIGVGTMFIITVPRPTTTLGG